MTELAIRILREVREAINTTYPDEQDPLVSLVIDFPLEGERVASDPYSIRIGAGPLVKNVEISINGDSWHRCRASEGYWWYDWHSYLPGQKYLLVRATVPSGEKIITSRRRFAVEFP